MTWGGDAGLPRVQRRSAAGLLGIAIAMCLGAPAALAVEPTAEQNAAASAQGEVPAEAPAAALDEVPPSAAPAEPLEADLGALQAELAASGGVSELQGDEPRINLYGFTDFTFTSQFGKRSPLLPWYPTFAIGNFNLYLSSEFEESWRALAEVRFLYLPHGQVTPSDFANPSASRVDTSIPDYADVNRPLRWGGVEIERVWLEHMVSNLLTIRAGQWLTPYGIWNVDHGSPVIVGVFRPYIIGDGLFPERQTGIELYGSVYVQETQVGYHLTLSNGRGPIDAYQDLDRNKAVGARLFLHNDTLLGNVTLGFSGYRGNYSDRRQNPVVFDPVEGLGVDETVTARYRELVLAADVKWEWRGLLVQSEALMSDVAYPDALRPASQVPNAPVGLAADYRRLGYYVVAGYRIPGWNLMPFAVWQFYQNPTLLDARELELGLNWRPASRVVLKGEFIHIWFPGVPDKLDFVTTQVAWSF